jgi:hypothetical protein
VQAVLDVHDTPESQSPDAPVGSGGVCIDQVVPFQRSADSPPPDPTAVQAVLDVHDTAEREPAPVGVAWIDQVVPFQLSASAALATELEPTAVHAVLDVHDTPESAL